MQVEYLCWWFSKPLSFLPNICLEVQQGAYLATKEESSLLKQLI